MEILYLLIAVVTLVLAWYLGRRSCQNDHHSKVAKHYSKGINLTIDEQPDENLEVFINSVEVNTDTLETHFAIGRLMRQRGEVDRAIKVHQNLLSRTILTQQQLQQAQMELAKDFLKAGLLDRAERLLLELVEADTHLSQEAAKHLMEIYQDEHEWDKAIRAASHCRQRAFSSNNRELSVELCQFSCELASEAMDRQDLNKVAIHLKQARKFRRESVRVNLLAGLLAEKSNRYSDAVDQYSRIPEQDSAMLPEALQRLSKCYELLNREAEFVELLRSWLIRFSDPRILIYLAKITPKVQLEINTRKLIADYLEQRPSAIGIQALLDVDEGAGGEDNDAPLRSKEQLDMIRSTIDKLVLEAPGYHCEKCGFNGEQLHWLCPQCKSWETVKPARVF